MIIVFCDRGGSRLLSKAREIADSTGDRVVALSSEESEELQQNLIFLGADEVLICDVENMGNWAPVISQLVQSESNVKIVIFPSDPTSNILMGLVYSKVKEKISTYLDGADAVDVDMVSKKFENFFIFRKRLIRDKTALISLKLASVAESFPDSSRYGKIRSVTSVESGIVIPEFQNPHRLTVLVGKDCGKGTLSLAKRVAEKYRGEIKENSGKIDVIYGPCIALEVSSTLRDLPEFKGELFSIATRNLPIASISEMAVVTVDIDSVLEAL